MIKHLALAGLLALAAGTTLADEASHAQRAEEFLKLAQADKMTVPIYAQVQQAFAARFAEAGKKDRQSLLESYQARANAELDRVVGWDKLRPELVKLYTSTFSEAELAQLIEFYRSPLGGKVLRTLPALTAQSAQVTQAHLDKAVPKVNGLLKEMSKELE